MLLGGKHLWSLELEDLLDIVEGIPKLTLLAALTGGAPLRYLDELLGDLLKELLILDQVGDIWKLQAVVLGHVGRRSRWRRGGRELWCTDYIRSVSLKIHHRLSKLRLFRI